MFLWSLPKGITFLRYHNLNEILLLSFSPGFKMTPGKCSFFAGIALSVIWVNWHMLKCFVFLSMKAWLLWGFGSGCLGSMVWVNCLEFLPLFGLLPCLSQTHTCVVSFHYIWTFRAKVLITLWRAANITFILNGCYVN